MRRFLIALAILMCNCTSGIAQIGVYPVPADEVQVAYIADYQLDELGGGYTCVLRNNRTPAATWATLRFPRGMDEPKPCWISMWGVNVNGDPRQWITDAAGYYYVDTGPGGPNLSIRQAKRVIILIEGADEWPPGVGEDFHARARTADGGTAIVQTCTVERVESTGIGVDYK